jgi:hypothetical protein
MAPEFLFGFAVGCGGVLGAALFGKFKLIVKISLIVVAVAALVWLFTELAT